MIDVDGLEAAGQGHLAAAVERLHGDSRARLIAQIKALDLGLITHLISTVAHGDAPVDLAAVSYTHLTLPTSDLV